MQRRATVPQYTWVAISYFVLGVVYMGMGLVLMSSIWTGSLTRLWRDLPSLLPSFSILALPMAINLTVAWLIYRYEHRRPIVRALGVIGALGLFVISFIGAVQIFTLWHRSALPGMLAKAAWTASLSTAIYAWLAFCVVRLARACPRTSSPT